MANQSSIICISEAVDISPGSLDSSLWLGFPGGSEGKESAAVRETKVHFLGQEDPLEKGMATHSSILGLENSVDRGAWWATVHGVAKSQTRLGD